MDDYVAMAKVMRPFSASTCEVRTYVCLVLLCVFNVCSHIVQHDNWGEPHAYENLVW